MANQKILYITTEMSPYQEEGNMASEVNKMALKMHQIGNDVRVFMPRFGLISERKFQLHEVIRLSGMNVIINDLDQPLIVKVASLPGERLQVYFIDNDEYFRRKQYYFDENNQPFSDNDERAIFFARGVIETVKKLNWVPDVIHLSGWMSAFVIIYLKNFYKTDAYFKDAKLVYSIYNEKDFSLGKDIENKLKFDEIENLKSIKKSTSQNFVAEAMEQVDLVIKGEKKLDKILKTAFENTEVHKIEQMPSEEEIIKIYEDLNK